MNCLYCNKEIISNGTKPSKYCSDKCRKAFGRANGQSPAEQTDRANGQTDKSEQTDTMQEQTDKTVLPVNFGLDNCQCLHCKQLKSIRPNAKLNHGSYMSASELKLNGFDVNRVSLSGDVDYIKV